MPSEARVSEKLLAISLGRPRDVEWRGEIVRTGIFKSPVGGPVEVERLGLAGDEQADLLVHGGPDKAVYAYDAASARAWQSELGRSDLGPGAFGENLTVEGWPETRVRIGDHFRVGSALFEVSQPRQPCMKLGLRMEDPRFPKRFFASARVGYYLRVLEAGRIEAGDGIVRVSSNAQALDIAQLVRIWLDRAAPVEALERACALDALAEAWRGPLRERLERAGGRDGAISG